MKPRSYENRRRSGSVTAEAPVVLWALLITVAFPLVDLTTAFIRMTFLYAATHNACINAARARSFLVSINNDPTAVSLAQSGANAVLGAFTGIHITKQSTAIVITNIVTQVETVQPAPLTTPADVNTFMYQVQVTTAGTADPLLPIPLPVAIAGLNAPLSVRFIDRQYFENPQGLVY